jgi:hypothetical protein
VVHVGGNGPLAFLPSVWTPAVGAVAGLFNLIVFVAIGALGRLLEPSPLSSFVGAWLAMLIFLPKARFTIGLFSLTV